jgi:aryl carrier-like protein
MVPAACVVVEEWPLTASGKVDRRRLAPPGEGRPALDTPYTAAEGEVERAVAALWRRILGLDAVGVDDNFFEAGGDSLLMVQVQSGLRETMGRDVPVVDLFRHPTIRTLAAHLAGSGEPAMAAATARGSDGRSTLRRQGDLRRRLRARPEGDR